MSSIAKPYKFSDFQQGAETSAAKPSCSETEVEVARQAAREDTIEKTIIREAQEQARLAALIAETLANRTDAMDGAVAAHLQHLTNATRDIVKQICAHAFADAQIKFAMSAVEQFLAKASHEVVAQLILSDKTSEAFLNSLNSALANNPDASNISMKLSSELQPGECRLEWQDGAIACDQDNLFAQIDTIFSSLQSSSADHLTARKGSIK